MTWAACSEACLSACAGTDASRRDFGATCRGEIFEEIEEIYCGGKTYTRFYGRKDVRVCPLAGKLHRHRDVGLMVSVVSVFVNLVWPFFRGCRTAPASGTNVGGLPRGRVMIQYKWCPGVDQGTVNRG